MNTIFNITNGDYLAQQLKEAKIIGEMITCREALVTGPLRADNLDYFWKLRTSFISNEYKVKAEDYFDKTFPEFEKILNIPDGSEVNLWFEDDLFCQVNLWFCLFLLPKDKDLKIYRIFPKTTKENNWKGFSVSESSDLEESLNSRISLDEKDIELGINLWKAYQNNDKKSLEQLSENQSNGFHFLKEVIDSYLHIKPEIFIKNLIENGTTDFNTIFEKFQNELGIFGFGDLQVKSIYDTVLKEKQ
ncbi:hypothetical protein ASG22_10640 [Chryseobacterium sp. Leaf405]|uniref:DUF1835 domain-containing protein n=1 Tax=Chryseobacterium sp. Leaf405 TaxID=1736367 RepID=UPI0006F8C755|nr:DUF1835 domain-containing protein [Chryseobacterium sp. Leaf405]KQT24454.1 hypothetical protein ASG22_10640 [Chryseobacterium sp. Leaf405]